MDFETMRQVLYFKTAQGFVKESMNNAIEHIERSIPLMETLVAGGEMTAFEALERIKQTLLLEVLALNEVQSKIKTEES